MNFNWIVNFFRGSPELGQGCAGALSRRSVALGDDNRRVPDAQMQPQPERRFQSRAQPKVERRPEFSLHGATAQLREGAEGSRRQKQAQQSTMHRRLPTGRTVQLSGAELPQSDRPGSESGLRDRVRQMGSEHAGRMRRARRDPIQFLGPSLLVRPHRRTR